MKYTGGAAFPRPISWDESPYSGTITGNSPTDAAAQSGMTLRDWFAGQALIGLAHMDHTTMARTSKLAYALADAMLVEKKGK